MPFIQLVRDFLFRRSFGVFREYVANYCGLFLVYGNAVYNALVAALVGVNEFIPVNEMPTAISAVFNARVQSVVYALGKALRILFVVPLQKHFVELAALVVADGFGCRNNSYAVPLFQLRLIHYAVHAITGETVKLIDNDLLECAAVRVGYHFLKVGAVVVRSRARFVLVGFYNGVALTFCVLGANANLPLDRLLVLSLRRITRINDCVFHCDLLLCAVCVCADCGLKILLFALVLTRLNRQKMPPQANCQWFAP